LPQDGDGRTESLLWNDDVIGFIDEFLSYGAPTVIDVEGTHNTLDGIGYNLGYEASEDIPAICEWFRSRMAHLMTCISWRQCPTCLSTVLKFINPDFLDVVYDEVTLCTCQDDREIDEELDDDLFKLEEQARGLLACVGN